MLTVSFNGLQKILSAWPWCQDFKNVLRFEIGLREGGEKNGQTDKQTKMTEVKPCESIHRFNIQKISRVQKLLQNNRSEFTTTKNHIFEVFFSFS